MEKNLGIQVHTGKPLSDVRALKAGVNGKLGSKRIRVDRMLVATGRKPCTSGLALGKAGVETSRTGAIQVDSLCRTSAAAIYAVGDVNGMSWLAHAATAQGILAAEHACGAGDRRWDGAAVPSCVFTEPELAFVGMSEAQAAEQEIPVRVARFPFSFLGKALAEGHAEGFVKWVVREDTDQLVGAVSVGAHATEMISEAVLAVQGEWTAAELATVIHAHPTMPEAWMEAAHAVHGACIHAPPRGKRAKSGKKK